MAVHGVIFDCLSKKIITVTVVVHQFFTLEMHNYKAIIEGSGSSVSKVLAANLSVLDSIHAAGRNLFNRRQCSISHSLFITLASS